MRGVRLLVLLAAVLGGSAFAQAGGGKRPVEDLAKSAIKSGFVPPADLLAAGSPGRMPMTLQEAMDKYGPQVRQQRSAANPVPQVLVFVSFSMPLARLESYVSQVREIGGAVILRGMHEGSVKKTMAKALESTPKGDVPWLIHPEMFEQFGVDKVPAVVIANQDGMNPNGETAEPAHYAKVYGDLSIEGALRVIKGRGNKAMAALAVERLERLERARR